MKIFNYVNENGEPNMPKLITHLVLGLFVFIIVICNFPFFIVNAGERGIVLRWGDVNRVVDEGIYWKTPIMESVTMIDIRIQKEQVDASAASKDLQTVSTKIALNYHLAQDKISELWKGIGKDYKSRIIDPAIQEAVKSATAKYTAEELITKREVVKDTIKIALAERLVKDFILVDELSITNFDFSKSFNDAIEGKVKAEQDALTQKNRLEQVKYEAEQAVATAKGTAEARITNAKAEAEAIKIQAQAITSQGGADYVQLQAIKQWNGVLPATFVPGSTMPFLNLK